MASTRAIRPSWMFTVGLAGCLAIAVCWVSANVHSRFVHHDDAVRQQQAIWERAPFPWDGHIVELPEFRGRVLMPALMLATRGAAGGSLGGWFLIWRVLTAFAMFVVVLRSTPGPWPWAALGGALFSYILILSFNHDAEQPTDFPDVAFAIGFCALTIARRFGWLVLLTVVAATNRESAAFAGVLWACVHGWPNRWRELAKGFVLCAIAYAVVLVLRHEFAVPGEVSRLQTLAVLQIPMLVREFVATPSPSGWPILLAASLAPVSWLLWRQRRDRTGAEHRLVAAGVIVVGVGLIFGLIDELRVLLPGLAILHYAALQSGRRLTMMFGPAAN